MLNYDSCLDILKCNTEILKGDSANYRKYVKSYNLVLYLLGKFDFC